VWWGRGSSVPRRNLENVAPDVREVFETAKALDREQIADLAYQLLRVPTTKDCARGWEGN
jgi:hypothetical protein